MVHDGVEITVRKVIHTEDYRLRLISLRVRPGAGWGWEGGGRGIIEDLTETSVLESTLAEVKSCVFQDLLMSRDEGGGEWTWAQKQDPTSVVFHAVGFSVCLHCHS